MQKWNNAKVRFPYYWLIQANIDYIRAHGPTERVAAIIKTTEWMVWFMETIRGQWFDWERVWFTLNELIDHRPFSAGYLEKRLRRCAGKERRGSRSP